MLDLRRGHKLPCWARAVLQPLQEWPRMILMSERKCSHTLTWPAVMMAHITCLQQCWANRLVVPNPYMVNLLATPCAMTERRCPHMAIAMDRATTCGRPHPRLQGHRGLLEGEGGRCGFRTPSLLFCFSLSFFSFSLSFPMYSRPFPWSIKGKTWHSLRGPFFKALKKTHMHKFSSPFCL
jgi:hypothetical protein